MTIAGTIVIIGAISVIGALAVTWVVSVVRGIGDHAIERFSIRISRQDAGAITQLIGAHWVNCWLK